MSSEQNRIQSLWVGPELGPMEVMCINSYLYHGHQFCLYVYDEVKNVPAGTTILDAGSVLQKNEIYVDKFGGFVNLSNLFRYTLLYKKGGWWVDMDTVCLRPFNFEQEYVFSSEYSDPYQRWLTNTTFIKSKPDAIFLKDCLHFLAGRGNDNIHWGELGVNLISRMIFRNDLGTYVSPSDYFCPVSAYHVRSFIEDENLTLPEESYALHWWNEIWRQLKIDKNAAFTRNCLYEKLKQKYC